MSRYWFATKDDTSTDSVYVEEFECEMIATDLNIQTLDFVLAPVPDSPNQYFVEVENMEGEGVRLGEYVIRDDGFHAIRFKAVLEDDDEK